MLRFLHSGRRCDVGPDQRFAPHDKVKMTQPLESARAPETKPESFREFLDSFAYGGRNDLLFKWLKRIPEEEAGEFLRGLLEKIGESIDDGDLERILEHVHQGNVQGYAGPPDSLEGYSYEDAPFVPLPGPLSQLKLGLLTATGSFVEGDDPEPFGEKNLTQLDVIPRIKDFIKNPPQLSTIPMDTPYGRLRVRHPGYDIRAVAKDPNVGLPLEHLRALQREGVIGALTSNAYSFVGAAAQRPLLKTHAPQWAELMKEQGAQAVLLVPA